MWEETGAANVGRGRLTGWWQINGRSEKPMHLNPEDDLSYVYNCMLWLDVKILLRTPLVVLQGKGAF